MVPEGLNNTELKALVSPKSPKFIQQVVGYRDHFKSPELAFHNAKDFIEYGANYSDVDLEQEGYIHRIVHPDILEAERKHGRRRYKELADIYIYYRYDKV